MSLGLPAPGIVVKTIEFYILTFTMPKTKESSFTDTYVNAANYISEASDNKSRNLQRQNYHVQRINSNSVKEAASPKFESNVRVVTANAPIHIPDLSEVSYSDFILYNYGQVYQKQYNPPGTNKIKL